MAEIPPEILDHMLDTKDALGRIEANQSNTFTYLQGVDKKLNEHVIDKGAHGLENLQENEKRSDRKWNTWATMVMAGGAFVDLLWRMFHKSLKGP